MSQVEVGKRYKHYKGNEYIVLEVGKHSETLEDLVVYQGQYTDDEFGDNPVWVRPRDLFEGRTEFEGRMIDRFRQLS